MSATNTRDRFDALLQDVTAFIGKQPLAAPLESALVEHYPADGATVAAVLATCQAAIAEGWMCGRESGGIRYGRVCKPSVALGGFSVDVVDMHSVRGPHHRHPLGEIDLIMPLTSAARFDGRGAGWLVYGPESAHHPTVEGGRALVLYLLPQGSIEFTPSPA